MTLRSIKEVIMEKDDLSEQEADELIADARKDLDTRLAKGEMPMDICEEWFGLEPDYAEELNSMDFIICHIREEIQKHEERVKHQHPINYKELDIHIQETVAKEFAKRDELEATLNNAGRPWTTEEDTNFRSSIDVMITMLAGRHKRSEGAIVSRLRNKFFSKY